jgi:TolB-like protein
VFHLGETGGNYFYVMEFVDGETLEELVRRSGELEPNVALEIVAQVAAGLTAIHKQHLAHRDIKASNIMVSLEEGRLETVKIIDLGLAKGVADEGTISAGLVVGWWQFVDHQKPLSSRRSAVPAVPEKSIAVLPFENISANKDDAYFADGVQDKILNNLAKIAQLKVISRTSVMQYRADNKRDLRQIANALGVANVLEGTVRRDGNHVRVSTELVDARSDNTIWADSYDRDLTDIFAIQSEVAQTIVRRLNATLSPEEKRSIEAKPTDNLEAYDLYLRANELIMNASASLGSGDIERPAVEAIGFLERAIQLDPKFTLAYCASGLAHDLLYYHPDATPERRALGDAAVNSALRLQPDLPEVHLAYAYHLYYGYQDYKQARAQLAIPKRGLPNDDENTIWYLLRRIKARSNLGSASERSAL